MGRSEKRTDAATSQGNHQHFSHPHILKLVNPTETLACNACEQPNDTTNKPFYGCNSCQFFLHENCLNAPRFLDHSSHPSHPLTLHSIPTYSTRSYTCKACETVGNGFSFSCARCEYDVHLQCASCPASILVADKHPHQLQLFFGSPYENKNTVYTCDICNAIMNKDSWLYYCAHCDFGSHLKCVISPEVGVFPRQPQTPNPNPNPSPNQNASPNQTYPNPSPNQNASPNQTLEMINSANEAHEQIIAAQLRAQIEARGREACLDLIRPARRYYI